jgi:CRISPR/Cas system-associated exonuclease Cas4 (RecB family)
MEIYHRLNSRPREDLLWAAVPGAGFSERDYFAVGPFEAIALPDLIFREGGETTIVDWKTGQEDEGDRLQMGAAGLWAAQRFGTPADGLKAMVVYLSEGREKEFPIESGLIAKVERTVRGEMEAMAAYLEDKENNIPCGREEFPKIENRRLCGWCEFQEICLKEESDDQE